MKVENDNGCSWINDLDSRSNIKVLEKNEECEWLIIGAGYTGLSVARKLSEIDNKKNLSQKFFALNSSVSDKIILLIPFFLAAIHVNIPS